MISQPISIPVTSCAFHQKLVISHFCKCLQCLLPLCKQCISIHRKEHFNMNEPMQLLTVQESIFQLKQIIQVQNNRISQFHAQIYKKLENAQILHLNIKKQIQIERDQILATIYSTYDAIIAELDQNTKRRQYWFKQFTFSVNNLKQQMVNIQKSLFGEKHLRTIIMWNRLKPQQIITQMTKYQKAQWQKPSYAKCDMMKLMNTLIDKKDLHVLQLEGDTGVAKLMKSLRVLRFGQQQTPSKVTRQSGIFITTQKKAANKLKSVKSAERL